MLAAPVRKGDITIEKLCVAIASAHGAATCSRMFD